MKKYTLRQIQDLPFEEKDKVLSEPCELGFKTSEPKTQFKALGVYLPIAEYEKLKSLIPSNPVEDLKWLLGNNMADISVEGSVIKVKLKGESDE